MDRSKHSLAQQLELTELSWFEDPCMDSSSFLSGIHGINTLKEYKTTVLKKKNPNKHRNKLITSQ